MTCIVKERLSARISFIPQFQIIYSIKLFVTIFFFPVESTFLSHVAIVQFYRSKTNLFAILVDTKYCLIRNWKKRVFSNRCLFGFEKYPNTTTVLPGQIICKATPSPVGFLQDTFFHRWLRHVANSWNKQIIFYPFSVNLNAELGISGNFKCFAI